MDAAMEVEVRLSPPLRLRKGSSSIGVPLRALHGPLHEVNQSIPDDVAATLKAPAAAVAGDAQRSRARAAAIQRRMSDMQYMSPMKRTRRQSSIGGEARRVLTPGKHARPRVSFSEQLDCRELTARSPSPPPSKPAAAAADIIAHDDEAREQQQPPQCEECEASDVAVRCRQCEQLLCEACSATIHQKGARARHSLLPYTHASATAPPPTRLSSGSASSAGSMGAGGGDVKARVAAEEARRRRWCKEDFEVQGALGKGRFGNVYLARERLTRAQVALKVQFRSAVLTGGSQVQTSCMPYVLFAEPLWQLLPCKSMHENACKSTSAYVVCSPLPYVPSHRRPHVRSRPTQPHLTTFARICLRPLSNPNSRTPPPPGPAEPAARGGDPVAPAPPAHPAHARPLRRRQERLLHHGGGGGRRAVQARARAAPGGRLPEAAAARATAQLARALAHLHARHVIHRDVKPENCLLDADGRVKLADFGCAVHAPPPAHAARATLCGTPEYLTPEMAGARAPRAYGAGVDVWALGVFAFELLCGATPFVDGTAAAAAIDAELAAAATAAHEAVAAAPGGSAGAAAAGGMPAVNPGLMGADGGGAHHRVYTRILAYRGGVTFVEGVDLPRALAFVRFLLQPAPAQRPDMARVLRCEWLAPYMDDDGGVA
ncbi:hypothetical protein JKP88DRAFT_296650 [Tribonema minus]|uniref:Non-specific serine/threonine protein kinase n=1 Tax=Tribonema minus TaxID=303371 RepID=A0A835ZDN3_9STRA|nr:hypothetical protein JKP88DRAFT_296650 [Tribonema minus]